MSFKKHCQVAQLTEYPVSSAVVWNCRQDTKRTFPVMMVHFPGRFCDVCTLLIIMKFLINVQLIFLLANRLKYFSSRNKLSDYWYKWFLRSPFIMQHLQQKFSISKKEEKLKLISLVLNNSLLLLLLEQGPLGGKSGERRWKRKQSTAYRGRQRGLPPYLLLFSH